MERPLNIKDKDVAKYIDYLEDYIKNPLVDTFVAVKSTVTKLNKQAKDQTVNMFDAEDKPKFEMLHKYMTEVKYYIEVMDYILSKMTPAQKDEAEKKLLSEAGSAELLALKHVKNGKDKRGDL